MSVMTPEEFERRAQQIWPGKSFEYFYGYLAEAAPNSAVGKLALVARKYGTPKDGFVRMRGVETYRANRGLGLGHLTQERVGEGTFVYRFTKALAS